MIIAIASGKGGTGKTTVAVNLAVSLGRGVQFLDCDVEEPNGHIFLKPIIKEKKEATIPVPQIDEQKCNYCCKCEQLCVYNALTILPPKDGRKGSNLIFAHLCHGCGVCSIFCPTGAITESYKSVGVVEKGVAGDINFIQGRLNIGEVLPVPIIRKAKQIEKAARQDNWQVTIIDAAPGTSCPVVTAVKWSDYCVLVTEPTPFGLNDLILAVEMLRELKVKFGVVINRADLGNKAVKEYCEREKIAILMEIPFQKEFAQAYSKGEVIVNAFPAYKEKFIGLYDKICEQVR